MKISERTLRISAASLLALLMVGSSYVLSGPNFLSDKIANAGTTEELLKAYSTKDTDGDTLPDWQEALYGTDPNKAISNSFGISDGEAARTGKLTPNSLASQVPGDPVGEESVEDLLNDIPGVDPAPGSITEQFSREFFQRYVEVSGGQPLSDEKQQVLIAELLVNYNTQIAERIASKYTRLSARPDATVSAVAYAGNVENILSKHIPPSEYDVLVLIQALIEKDDSSALPKLEKLRAGYENITSELLVTPVPPQLLDAHISMARGTQEVARAIELCIEYKTDPIATLGAIPTLYPSRVKIITSMQDIAIAAVANGELAPGTPGAYLVDFARKSEAQ